MICGLIICAVQTVGIMTASAHTNGGYESFTPGIYAVSPQGLAAGVYSNSHGDASAFLGKQFESRKVLGVSAGLLVGGVVGYGKPSPLLVPSMSVNFKTSPRLFDGNNLSPRGEVDIVTVRLSYIPKHPSKPTGSDALHMSFEWRFK